MTVVREKTVYLVFAAILRKHETDNFFDDSEISAFLFQTWRRVVKPSETTTSQ